MKAQKPAEGISQINEFSHSIWYRVDCECQDPDHCHTVDVNTEFNDVTVDIYTTVSTPFWSKSRWKMIWEILTKGYASHEATIILNKRSALNYAEALKGAIKELENRRDAR